MRSKTVHGNFSSIYGKDKPFIKDNIKIRDQDWTVYRSISSVGLTFILQYIRLVKDNITLSLYGNNSTNFIFIQRIYNYSENIDEIQEHCLNYYFTHSIKFCINEFY